MELRAQAGAISTEDRQQSGEPPHRYSRLSHRTPSRSQRSFAFHPVSIEVSLLARQPIHDAAARIAGYELLFRSADATCALIGDPTTATAEVATRALFDRGLETLVGPHSAWINIDRDFLVRRAFMALPPKHVVLEVLETVRDDPEVMFAMRAARQAGYAIALDDFELRADNAALVSECDYIKLDCLGLSPERIKERMSELLPSGATLLAEKVESREAFETCRDAGAKLFQGYYFTRPEPVQGVELRSDRLRLLRVLTELSNPKATIDRLAELIQTDVTLAYRLLRFSNSASLGRARRFENVRDAITMLGLDRVRACTALMALTSMSDKPAELARMALVRARYCQHIGEARQRDAHKHFAAGLFSVLDAYLGDTMENVLRQLPLDAELSAALSRHEGELGQALDVALACERADWSGVAIDGVSVAQLAEALTEAMSWADSLQSAVEVA